MTPRSGSTTAMTAAEVRVRADHARAFLEAARLASQFADEVGGESTANVVASNAVLAGIAAVDAICGRALGERSSTQSHADAVALLKRAHGGEAAANQLRGLVSIKSASAYEPRIVTSAKAADALQRAERLVAAMEELLR